MDWIKRFIFFYNKRHSGAMGKAEIKAFLSHLAVARKVAASTKNQALSAILFLYKEVLGREPGDVVGIETMCIRTAHADRLTSIEGWV